MGLQRILSDAHAQRHQIFMLRAHSPYYPDYLSVVNSAYGGTDNKITYSTLIRKEHEGKWYTVHVVESFCSPTRENFEKSEEDFLKRFLQQAYLVFNFHIVNPDFGDQEDALQISEQERLIPETLKPKKR